MWWDIKISIYLKPALHRSETYKNVEMFQLSAGTVYEIPIEKDDIVQQLKKINEEEALDLILYCFHIDKRVGCPCPGLVNNPAGLSNWFCPSVLEYLSTSRFHVFKTHC